MASSRNPALALAVAALAMAMAAAPARAQGPGDPEPRELDGDYDIASSDWNGLATVAAIARGSGLKVVSRERVDWAELDKGDVVLLLYPTNNIDPAHIISFVRGGGRILIADDFGLGAQLMQRLGMDLKTDVASVKGLRYHDSLSYAPLARPLKISHPLASGVDELATNHPAILTRVDGPEAIFGFSEKAAVVTAGDLGEGRCVVLSDPSVIINRMLQFEGNLQFVINLLRYLSHEDTERVVVLAGEVIFRGRPQHLLDDDSLDGTAGKVFSDFDSWLDDVNEYLLTPQGIRILAGVFAVALAIFSFMALPRRRGAALDGTWTRVGSPALAAYDPARWDDDRLQSGFALPAAVLRDNLNEQLGQVLGREDPLYSMRDAELLEALARNHGRPAAAQLAAILPLLTRLPTRSQATSLWDPPQVPRRDFSQLHDAIERLYRILGSQPRAPHGR